jgi:vacuolar-type H+-ATPase subunit H
MWASIVSALMAWEKSAKILEQIVEAYISFKVQTLRSQNEEINRTREEIIKQINLARAQRDSIKLINLNRALYLVEYAGMQLNKDKTSDSQIVRSP